MIKVYKDIFIKNKDIPGNILNFMTQLNYIKTIV